MNLDFASPPFLAVMACDKVLGRLIKLQIFLQNDITCVTNERTILIYPAIYLSIYLKILYIVCL